ncbi:Mur ligase family protein [Paraconexibacter antarcticus]|uniref:UDP-N-acetylmuramoylalanine--D-glutamate ligase n=1 Tax=Paraconexibacter antarcticus TaxID=2949664 RepID=A0ABY5DPM4_9ACTN|nr:Mur ligase family protein [Paraconexibacter antarcticus]UTI63163.1 Mur ligase family protein [Paraconexibacter antarcticus]
MNETRPALPEGPWLVVGLARSGLAAGRALAARGATVTGVDSGTPALPADVGFPVQTGVDGLARLDGTGAARAVVKSPGVPPRAPVVAAARAAGLPVLGEVELAWRLVGAPVVAVTGTNGKTTVTEWLGHAWRCAGRPVRVVGNVGLPYTSLIGTDLEPGTTVVLECSSYQLFDTLAFRPEVGVLLNLESDHLDWHGSVEAYAAAKLDGMFGRQLATDVAIVPAAVAGRVPGAAARVLSDDVELPAEPALPGAHNRANARAVVAAARACGLPEDAIAEALRTFAGVEHRLREIAVVDGVRYVDDSKATNVASALTALAAIDAPLHLILGGDDAKQEDFGPLRAPVAARAASVQLVGAAAGRLQAALGTGTDRGDLGAAVAAARAAARPGDVVLLSPACASFGQYANYEERGRHFRSLVSAFS